MGRPGRSNLGKTPFPTRSRRRRLLLGRLDGEEVADEQACSDDISSSELGEATPDAHQSNETSAFSHESLRHQDEADTDQSAARPESPPRCS